MRGNEISLLIGSLYQQWQGKGMIADMEGVPQVTINTSTTVLVLLLNDRGESISIDEAPRVEATLRHTLSRLGVFTSEPQVERQFQPDTGPLQNGLPPSFEQVNPTHATRATSRPLFPQVGASQGTNLQGGDQDDMGSNGSFDIDEELLRLEGEANQTPSKVTTVNQLDVNTTPLLDSRGKQYDAVCDSANRDRNGKQIVEKIIRTRGKEGETVVFVQYTDGIQNWVPMTKLPLDRSE